MRELRCTGVTEIGPVKAVNQDAYLVKRAQTPWGDVALVVVADGMSGLQQGEVASAQVVRAFDQWFQRNLPLMGESLGFSGAAFARALQTQWANLLQETNLWLMQRGLHQGVSLGAACTALLVAADAFYVAQVGDTRLYRVTPGALEQLTLDQTFAAREVAAGRMAPEEAERHPLRNTLLQCVGASQNLEPVFFQGSFDASAAYLVCSDGFRRSFTEGELAGAFHLPQLRTQQQMEQQLKSLMGAAFARGQRDNATAVLLRGTGEGGDAPC